MELMGFIDAKEFAGLVELVGFFGLRGALF